MRPNKEFAADLVTFTEEIINEPFHFLYSVYSTESELTLDAGSNPGSGVLGLAMVRTSIHGSGRKYGLMYFCQPTIPKNNSSSSS